jgi:hypothetical protein
VPLQGPINSNKSLQSHFFHCFLCCSSTDRREFLLVKTHHGFGGFHTVLHRFHRRLFEIAAPLYCLAAMRMT